MKEIGRNIRFFGQFNIRLIGQMILFVIVFSAVMASMEEGAFAEEFLATLGFYLILIGIIITFIQAAVGYLHYMPIAVSMSNTRKSALIGMQTAFYLMVILLLGGTLLLWKILPFPVDYWQFRYVYIGVFMVITVMSNIMGTVILKAGVKIGFIVYLILYIMALVVAITMIAVMKNVEELAMVDFSWFNSIGFAAVGTVVSLVSACMPYLGIRKFEVRA